MHARHTMALKLLANLSYRVQTRRSSLTHPKQRSMIFLSRYRGLSKPLGAPGRALRFILRLAMMGFILCLSQ